MVLRFENTGGGGSASDVEMKLMADDTLNDGSVIVNFLRRYSTVAGVTTTDDFELDGTTAYTVLGTVSPAGGDANGRALAPEATELVETVSYTNVLAPGTYTRANVLALLGGGATQLISMAVTIASGTGDFAQGGSIMDLQAGSIIDKPYAAGFAIDDFTLTVDAGSTAYIEARGL